MIDETQTSPFSPSVLLTMDMGKIFFKQALAGLITVNKNSFLNADFPAIFNGILKA